MAMPVLSNDKETNSMPKIKVQPLCASCHIPMCENCHVCETATCPALGQKAESRVDLIKAGLISPRTQKALGYNKLVQALNGGGSLRIPVPYYVIGEEADIDIVSSTIIHGTIEFFARPCPMRPRHGFVESRGIDKTDKEQIRAIFKEAQAADPQAELLLCPKISATLNAVITPTKVAIGSGNDGATVGKDTVEFPLLGVPFGDIPKELISSSGVKDSDSPYFEAVNSSTGNWYLTQLRAGPKLEGIEHDFIPEDMVVDTIIEASGDLQEWEKQVPTIKEGTVVVHMGGTLVSHYGVHCLINGIPIMTSRVPAIGERLIKEPKGDLRSFDPQEVIKGIAIGIKLKLDTSTAVRAINFMLVTTHNAAAMSNGYGVWLGIAAITMMKLGMAAAHGEERHKNEKTKALGRAGVYNISFKDFFGSRKTLKYVQESFLYGSWGGGFGGKKWAACTDSIIKLDNSIKILLDNPTQDSVKDIIQDLNQAINQAHNNGWWMNKFTSDIEAFDKAAQQNLSIILHAAEYIYSISKKPLVDLSVIDTYKEQEFINIEVKQGEYNGVSGDVLELEQIKDFISTNDEINALVKATPGCECGYCLNLEKPLIISYISANEPVACDKGLYFDDDINDLLDSYSKGTKVIAPKEKSFGVVKHPTFPLGAFVEAAHARYNIKDKSLSVHIQYKLNSNRYMSTSCTTTSIDLKFISEIAGKIINTVPEGSYSSHATGYYPLQVEPKGYYDPCTDIQFISDDSSKLTISSLNYKGINYPTSTILDK